MVMKMMMMMLWFNLRLFIWGIWYNLVNMFNYIHVILFFRLAYLTLPYPTRVLLLLVLVSFMFSFLLQLQSDCVH